MTTARFATLSIAVAVSFAVLVGLGVWQLQRMAWKADLLARLDAASQLSPVALPTPPADGLEFRRVSATGSFRHDAEMHLFGTADGQPGWRIVTPFTLADGATVLVIRGFVPDRLKQPATRRDGQVEGEVEITGRLRGSEAGGMFVPDNVPRDNKWYRRDLAEMIRTLPRASREKAYPYFIELEAAAHEAVWPKPVPIAAAQLHNRHFQYALTWFGLAGVLLAVYGAVCLRRRKP